MSNPKDDLTNLPQRTRDVLADAMRKAKERKPAEPYSTEPKPCDCQDCSIANEPTH